LNILKVVVNGTGVTKVPENGFVTKIRI
jgi:hypothetical protein